MNCEVYNVLTLLKSTPKRKEKISILARYSEFTLLNSTMKAALDPFVQYHIRKIPNYVSNGNNLSLGTFLSSLNEFSERTVTGNAAIARLTALLEDLDPHAAIVAERIIKKDLRCGVQASTVNKVHEKFIPTYPCLLGKPYDEKSIRNIVYPAYVQIKADGMRANVHFTFTKNGINTVVIRGRSGKLVNLHGCLDDSFCNLGKVAGKNVVFDGELIVLDENGKIMSRKKGNGILNKAVKGTISQEEASRVCMRIWDIIDTENFLQGHDDTPYNVRFARLQDMVSNAKSDKSGQNRLFNHLTGVFSDYQIIKCYVVNSIEEVIAHFKDARDKGEEGIMIKNMDHPWEDKRSTHLVKMKAECDCDLKVIGYNLGTPGTKNEHKMGSLICASSDGKVEVSISGFSDNLRDEITRDIDEWIGCIVTVTYNERITSKDKNRKDIDSLFLPRFECLRTDKFVADTSDKIL